MAGGSDSDGKRPRTTYAVRDAEPEVIRTRDKRRPKPPSAAEVAPPSSRRASPPPATPAALVPLVPLPSAPRASPAAPIGPLEPRPVREAKLTVPSGDRPRFSEQVNVTGLSAVGTATEPPPGPKPGPTPREKAHRIVLQLQTCGPEDEGAAVQSLLAIGDDALPAIEDDFPGLLWFHRELAHTRVPSGRDIGPLARALVAFGDASQPVLTRLIADRHADRRYYAVLVAGDMESISERTRRELVTAIAPRFFDPDVDVRIVAVGAVRNLSIVTEGMLEVLGRHVGDPSVGRDDRLFGLQLIRDLRLVQSIELLVTTLDDHQPDIRQAAQEALRVLCAEDCGPQSKRWRSWLKKRDAKPRVSWLLEGLEHKNEQLRQIAHRELVLATGHDVGFDATMGRGDRKRARRAYEEWLAARGR